MGTGEPSDNADRAADVTIIDAPEIPYAEADIVAKAQRPEAACVARELTMLIERRGKPGRIISDNGT
ncbi:hypothetical protein FS799_17840 [Agrobacterium vitis]|nr:hypothetical protein [Agrobacterium vitis]MUO71116.1 hypothetical protein [Agrobacterium vitis]MUO84421.1 hypothetical protein [Agrobacterium vitis]MVA38099.1 hypothetical protein [Agrobacterium vitis]